MKMLSRMVVDMSCRTELIGSEERLEDTCPRRCELWRRFHRFPWCSVCCLIPGCLLSQGHYEELKVVMSISDTKKL